MVLHVPADTPREALAMQRKFVGVEHQVVASFLDTLALVLRDQARLAEAEASHREALAMQRKLLGTQHPDIAGSLNNLAQVLRDHGRLTEAETMLRDALAMRRKLLGDEHPEAAASLFDLARVLRDQRRVAEAEAAIRECLAIREKHSLDDWRLFDAEGLLGGLLLDQKKSSEAAPWLQSSIEGMKQREDKIPALFKPRLRETLNYLLQLFEPQGQPDKAAEWKKKLTPRPHLRKQPTSPPRQNKDETGRAHPADHRAPRSRCRRGAVATGPSGRFAAQDTESNRGFWFILASFPAIEYKIGYCSHEALAEVEQQRPA